MHSRTITEQAREIEICREADVVVVGGGPGGIGSALAAARSGADTVLVERYGHLGGMATGGLVTIIPNLSDISGEQQITGICQELVDRLDAKGATHYPKKEDWGSADEKLVKRYTDANLAWFYIRHDLNIGRKRVLYTALIDPEIMKCELNTMMQEAGVELYLHSWGTRPIVDGNTVKGVFIENKSGRQAILAKVVIDSCIISLNLSAWSYLKLSARARSTLATQKLRERLAMRKEGGMLVSKSAGV